MSTRVTASARMNATCQQLLRERLNLALNATVDLSELNVIMETQQLNLTSLQELLNAEQVSLTLGALAPDTFEHTRAMLARAEPSADQWSLAASVQARLADTLAAAGAMIDVTTRDITAEAFADAGAELGYAVSMCRGDAATGVELRRAHEILLLRVHDGGAIESDHAGLVDATCGDRQLELERAVARRGITLTDRHQHDHGSAQGGKLIQVAASRRDPSLARATALDSEQPQVRAPARGRLASVGRAEDRRRTRTWAGGAG